jgi:F-type H+-transporting ATPase subunit b
MWKIAVPGIADVLESRQKRIKDNLEKASRAKQEAEETFSAYEESIKEARAEAQKMHFISANKLTKEVEASEIILVDELSKIITKNELEIQTAIDNASENIRKSAIDVASEAIQRLTGQVPDVKKLNGAIERALKLES